MTEEIWLARIYRRGWISDGPLSAAASLFAQYLREHRYSESSFSTYLKVIAHLGYWMKAEGLSVADIDEEMFEQFKQTHLPKCSCPEPCRRHLVGVAAALKHFLIVLRQQGLTHVSASENETGIEKELSEFKYYLLSTRGVAQSTCQSQVKHIRVLLEKKFPDGSMEAGGLTTADIEDFVLSFAKRWKPASLKAIRGSLRSYLRYRSLRGDQHTQSLLAAMPVIAHWKSADIPKFLTIEQVTAFLNSFDRSHRTEQRDFAIARCLLDLGLRGREVMQLSLESIDWRNGTLTIQGKGRRIRQMPLPHETGQSIAEYLEGGRPRTSNRALFVRHVAPFDRPLDVDGIRKAMTRAFVRCGLGNQFCNTHVLRHTTAMRLQESGASLKEIADVLRHATLQSTTIYAKADIKSLRKVALPWPGSES
jgi:site-specific recombinase XerD